MRRVTIVLAVGLAMALPIECLATTWEVPGDAATIQGGIDLASPGDSVLVHPGTYTGVGNKDLDFGGKDLVLRSEAGPAVTIIDCEGGPTNTRGISFHSGESLAAVVEGFTIKNGYCGGAQVYWGGAGIYCVDSSPSVINCVLTGHSASEGAGVCCCNSSATLTDCTFSENWACVGGGLGCRDSSSVEVIDCRFVGNSAGEGAGALLQDGSLTTLSNCTFLQNSDTGIYCSGGSATLTNCTFSGNSYGVELEFERSWATLTNCTFSRNGSGMYLHSCSGSSGATVTNCTFSWSSYGVECDDWEAPVEFVDCDFFRNGIGMHLSYSSPTLTGCKFWKNSSTYGGGMLLNALASPTLTNCTFVDNTSGSYGGGGMSCYYSSYPLVTYCSFARNSAPMGGEISCEFGSAANLNNTIIAFSTEGEAVYCDGTSSATLTCCDIYGNAGGDWVGCIAGQQGVDGNISVNPRFCDLSRGFLGLQEGSPCAPFSPPNEECDLVGALPVGCGGVPVEHTTWGRIKAIYR